MERRHHYTATVRWTGATDGATTGYAAYSRDHEIQAGDAPSIAGSSDPAFRGDPARSNPEQLLVGSLSACHMLWYLHLCAEAGIAVTAYTDAAEGEMSEGARPGRFVSVVLRPEVTIRRGGDVDRALRLHARAHAECFIANSVAFPVTCEPNVLEETP